MSELAPLRGLVLAGGRSSRMKRDKASLAYGGQTQVDRSFELLAPHTDSVHLSCRAGQWPDGRFDQLPQIHDRIEGQGPMVGILSAMACFPDSAWIVVACDLPFLTADAIAALVAARDAAQPFLAYASAHDDLPEPLCAIYEPASAAILQRYLDKDMRCPRKVLIRESARLLELADAQTLDNVNHPDEYEDARRALGPEAKTDE